MLLRDVEVEGARTDVRVSSGTVVAMGTGLRRAADEAELEGRGGALLPGLHDHHIHLHAAAAARASVDCHFGLDALRKTSDPVVRGIGLNASVDRWTLDSFVADRPVRVQHRSGALWMLNSSALAALQQAVRLDDHPGVERTPDGLLTGRLWRADDLIREVWPASGDLQALGVELALYGITSVTDATPGLTTPPSLPQEVTLLGHRKILLHDHDLPSYDELRHRFLAVRERGSTVAVHCVTRESLMLTLAVFDELGRFPGDRIEHGAVIPNPRALRGLHVVTQPGFVVDRGDDYRRNVDPRDLPDLYRFASLIAAGVDVVASSDAPYGPLDPWAVLRAASERHLGPAERVSPRTALDGYLRDPDFRRRRVEVGARTALVLLHTSLEEALDALDPGCVRQILLPPST